jgi:hypothetical protein
MSIISCLIAKANLGKVTKSAVDKIQKHVELLQNKLEAGDDVAKELKAAQQALDDGTFNLQRKQQRIVQQAEFIKKWNKHVDAVALTGGTEEDALRGLFYSDPRTKYNYKQGLSENILPSMQDYRNEAFRKYQSKVHNVLNTLKRNTVTGALDESLEKEVFSEIWALERGGPKTTKNKVAQETAKQIHDLSIFGGQEFDRLGGAIKLRNDYFTGAFTDPDILKTRGLSNSNFKDEWVNHVMGLGPDVDHINTTLQTNFKSEGQLRTFLKSAFDSFVAGGPIDPTASYIPAMMRSVANSRNLHRILLFKTPESTLEYMKAYGPGNLGDLIQNYVNVRSIEDAALQTFGGMPNAAKNAVLAKFQKVSPTKVEKLTGLFDRYSRSSGVGQPRAALSAFNLSPKLDNFYKLASSSLLGKVGLWQMVTDMWNLPMLSNNLKGMPAIKQIGSAYKALLSGPGNLKAKTETLAKMGYISEVFYSQFLNNTLTKADQGLASSPAAYFFHTADSVVRKVGGTSHSINATVVGQIEFLLQHLSSIVESGKLNHQGEGFGNWLRSAGITDDVIKYIKANGMNDYTYGNHSFNAIDLMKLDELGTPEAREATLAITRAMKDHEKAVNPVMPGELKAWVDEISKSGTVGTFAARGTSFLASYLTGNFNNMLRMANQAPGNAARLKVFGAYMTMAMVTGYQMSVISDLLLGKDVPPMSPDLLGRVTARAMGPIGDALISAGDSFGQGDMISSFVPGIAMAQDISKSLIQTGKHVVTGDIGKTPADLARFFNKTLPGQSLPIVGLLMRRYITDQILMQLDPEAHTKVSRSISNYRTRTGSDYFWKPGETRPDRKPDMSKMLELYNKPE